MVYLTIPSVSLHVRQKPQSDHGVTGRNTALTKRTFTDLNRLMLKCIIYEQAPAKYQTEFHRTRSTNPSDLSRKLDSVSKPKTYQFARTFKQKNLLDWDDEGFFFPNIEVLLERWLAAEREVPIEKFPVQSLFGKSFDEVVRRATSQSVGYAVAGFEGCQFHGKLYASSPVRPELYVFDDIRRAINELEVGHAEPHNADFWLLRPKYETSIVEELRFDADKIQYVDLLQAALDTIHHPQRGKEQAEFIMDTVVRWVENE
ncbi:MAG: hypothetical protein ABEN55_00725 [Bradymonadaceae bacterium]